MAIAKMTKFTLITFSKYRVRLLRELQHFKYVHFLDLTQNKILKNLDLKSISLPESINALEENMKKTEFAIKVLEEVQERESVFQKLKKGPEGYDLEEIEEQARSVPFDEIYEEISTLVRTREHFEQECQKLSEKIMQLTPWLSLNIPFKILCSLKQCTVLLGMIPKKLKENFTDDLSQTALTYFHIVNEDHEHVYVIVVSHHSKNGKVLDILARCGFTTVRFSIEHEPEKEVHDLKKKAEKYRKRIHEMEKRLKEMSAYLKDLKLLYEYFALLKVRHEASEKFLTTDHFHIIEGYVPEKFSGKFQKAVKKILGKEFYLHMKEADTDDPDVPVLLENRKFTAAFESITEMYAMPKYSELDPTPLLTIFYFVFFGMMVADLGYGLFLFITTFLVLKYLNLSEKQKRFIHFFHYLSYSVMLWGLIYGSFLGGIIPLPAVIHATEEYHSLLLLSVALGVIHIFFALGIKAYNHLKNRQYFAAVFDVGFWYLVLSGGIIFIISLFVTVSETLRSTGLHAMIIGAAGILLTGGRENKTFGGKIAGGLYSLYGISGYIGDFVSYTRLMALCLSSAFLASAINMIIDMLLNLGWFGVFPAIIVFVIGSAFNLFLSMLSSYVHTLRLTYVEFFGKFYEGGGKAFRPFINEPKYIRYK